MKTYKITKTNFMLWYFFTGADQDQKAELYELGRNAREGLVDDGEFIITAQSIFDSVDYGCIGLKFLEEFDDDKDGELYDLGHNYKLDLI
jgi:hypothetical protein